MEEGAMKEFVCYCDRGWNAYGWKGTWAVGAQALTEEAAKAKVEAETGMEVIKVRETTR
jgi:hypothetical protein